MRTECCELCAATLGSQDKGHIDHIVPEAFVCEHELGDPHNKRNLICLCRSCHGKKTAVESKLYRADLIGFLGELRRLGWDRARVVEALVLYGLFPKSKESLE